MPRKWSSPASALLVAVLAVGSAGCGDTLPIDGSDGGVADLGGSGGSACGRMTANPSPGDAFATAKWALVATWTGTATAPAGWTTPSPYHVAITFRDDGSYTALTTDAQSPFYYDGNPDQGRYELVDLHANGDVSGNLYFAGFTAPEELRAIRFDAARTKVHFEFFHEKTYGPIVFELDCAAHIDPTIYDMTMTPTMPADLSF